MMGGYYFPPSGSSGDEGDRGYPSDSKLLKIIQSGSLHSNQESTIDKTPIENDLTSTFCKEKGTKIPRKVQQPNRFEKSLDQTLILENEFKKNSAWSKQKMQELAQALDLTVSQVYKWNWDRRQSNAYHYFKLCSQPIKSRKPLFSVTKVVRDRRGQDSALFSVSKKPLA